MENWTKVCRVWVGLALLGMVVRGEERDLASLDIEQLMDIRVTSVQRKEQSVARTAAAVTVITREDI
ncbi:MAG: hypothetical protein J0L64_20570, partial [Acidobacteria bacterium]|nr:hypothetical protein [Acidobacteriota bacterium]